MAIFKSREERQRERQEHEANLLSEFLKTRNLEELTEDDKRFVGLIQDGLESVTMYSTRGSEAEVAQTEIMMALTEQNWLIIKLLNDISQKLDR
jgi:polynucleotide 5'-kinase involved in rRNA processing